MPPASDDWKLTCTPPRTVPAGSANAAGGALTGIDSAGDTCASVACCTVTGTAGTTCCDTLMRSDAPPPSRPPACSLACTSHITVPVRE
jgi:hypothetical protein